MIHLYSTPGAFICVEDAHSLQEEIERQGRANYLSGDYINIRVEIPRKDGRGVVSFITGWTARPHGEIKLNTPYGGSKDERIRLCGSYC